MNITNYLEENYPDYMNKILLADGFEEAFMGVVESFGNEPKACYNYDTCIDILMEQMIPSAEDISDNDKFYRDWHGEAEEYFNFNVSGAYVGEHTPAFIKLDVGEQKI
jgi:hypothetical protein